MNKTKLKAYAPQARKDFIAAVTARANLLGLSENRGALEIATGEKIGDIAIIAGREWPVKVYSQREDLIKRMTNEGFNHTVEAVAYTWFNRFAALRYMEIHDYLDHGHRALSNREGGMPEILNHATELDLPGLNKAKTIELKLAGNKDNDLYKFILVAQCNALSNAMPFLFERIDDETELLLPDNLLLTDSVIAKLVADIPEDDWAEVEIIGWLYQFYISEKKDEVIGKVVKSEDIPAATQLFTPNWIVQYLVQNSVGRLWMIANPSSTLKSQWPYYIDLAEQTPEVQAQLNALIQTRMNEDGGNLNPETITVLDPACGSGHILVEAYEILKQIYLERGYQPRAIPRLIIENNIYGIDIDDRAAQLAGFALLMKARADDRRILQEPPKLNVISLKESKGLDADQFAQALSKFSVNRNSIADLINIFQHAKTFGSLIQIPAQLVNSLQNLNEQCHLAIKTEDLFAQEAAQSLLTLITQASLLAKQYDAVIANPPYMGRKYVDDKLKDYCHRYFPDTWHDLFSVFIERGFNWCKSSGFHSMVTMQSWMFLSSYETMREKLLSNRTLTCMVHMGNNVMGIAFGTVATVMLSKHINSYQGNFSYCENGDITELNVPKEFPVKNDRLKKAKPDDFKKIPGSPIAYWINDQTRNVFAKNKLSDIATTFQGIITGNNELFVKNWFELSISKIEQTAINFSEIDVKKRYWVPYNKGGESIRWYGNQELVVNFKNLGKDFTRGKLQFSNYFFKECFSWTYISSTTLATRHFPSGFIWDVHGSSAFPKSRDDIFTLMSFIGSKVGRYFLNIINPTISFQVENIAALPIIELDDTDRFNVINATKRCIALAKKDWDNREISREFISSILLELKKTSLPLTFDYYSCQQVSAIQETVNLENQINNVYINAFHLQSEVSGNFSNEDATLKKPNRLQDSQRLVSYAIGCMMGRYSLDAPGLIYAHAKNEGFDASKYITFQADTDGILPITDMLWFEDDAANRIREFLLAVWSAETLDENMTWLAESLGNKGNETPEESIRRYLASSFYKNHLQTYKKRPIYWLFSSGKQGAFQALVYLHRYNEGTLARMRSEYVVPLTGKMLSRIEMLEKDAVSLSSPAARTKISKEIEVLRKQHIELLAYDEKLRHYADMRIQLDLDDGVKVNYGKFGDLLAEVKVVTGGAADE